jgi:hypothetical protein
VAETVYEGEPTQLPPIHRMVMELRTLSISRGTVDIKLRDLDSTVPRDSNQHAIPFHQ